MAGVVIGISGAPGSGKSSLARALVPLLGDATAIHMDHYEQMTRRPIAEIAAWAARGADVDELPVPGLAEHLAALKAGRPVTDPATGATLRPARFVVFETQFGRDHRATGHHIDLLVWLDTPREIALARTLRQLAAEALAAPAGEHRPRLEWLHGYLENYLAVVQPLVARQRERVRPGADLVIAGGDAAALAQRVRAEAVARFGVGP